MSFRRGLFREEAVAHRGTPEPLDGLLRVTAPHEWAILAALGLSVLGVAMWALLGAVERDFTATCALVLAGERHHVVSNTTGTVVEVLAQPGDRVAAGEPVARIRVPELDHEVGAARARVKLIEQHADAGEDAFLGVLATARAELLDLESRREVGGRIVSPYDGEITAQNLIPEQQVSRGSEVAMLRSSKERRFEAITLVSADDAPALAVGMQSQVIYPARDRGAPTVLEAEVSRISPRPVFPDRWLDSLGLAAPAAGGHLVTLALSEPPTPMVADGDPCRLRVILSRDAPWRLAGRPVAAGAGG